MDKVPRNPESTRKICSLLMSGGKLELHLRDRTLAHCAVGSSQTGPRQLRG